MSRNYKVRFGSRGGQYIMSNGKKKYLSSFGGPLAEPASPNYRLLQRVFDTPSPVLNPYTGYPSSGGADLFSDVGNYNENQQLENLYSKPLNLKDPEIQRILWKIQNYRSKGKNITSHQFPEFHAENIIQTEGINLLKQKRQRELLNMGYNPNILELMYNRPGTTREIVFYLNSMNIYPIKK